ncbi:MAG: ABC transporter substrate-binding protein [Gammaproteobacteria bacterium]|nr:MAG: ABC transporter substrate-binding protein [Gammaproteobacteria bacterium]
MGRLIRAGSLLVLVLLAACRSPDSNTLVFAIATAPASLHPVLATDAVSERINGLLYRPLVEFDAQARPVPGVIRWQRLDDRRYRLQLVAGVPPFWDGSRVDPGDVAATLRAARDDPASPHAGALRHLQRIEVHESHLVVTLSRDDPRFPERLHLGVAPAERLAQGARLARHPLGNGPFRFVAWEDDGGLTLKRRRDGLLVRFAVVRDPTMRALKLMHGEADIVQNDLPFEMYPVLQGRGDIALRERSGTTFSYIGFNLEDPVTGDHRVRQAIAHAIDREAIVRHLFMGHARLAETVLPPGHWAAHPGLKPWPHDPARARALLAELGYGPGHPLVIHYKTSTDPFRLRVAAVLQAQLRKVGIDLRIQSNEWGTFFGDIKAGRFQMYSLSWVGVRSPDIFRHVFHSGSLPPGGANRGRYRSPEVDRLIEHAEGLPREQARTLYHRVQAIVHQALVYVPLWHEHNLLLSRRVVPVTPLPDGSYHFLEQVHWQSGEPGEAAR